ncbi:hypothetical protein [Candidatus Uabimicrobium sp. HlEnr_7]|uniref:hypothetical protein n=1 Tax=Candidatus Uabimicrobium helgolandensis TaxID=3095367 RepID=UPI0035564766
MHNTLLAIKKQKAVSPANNGLTAFLLEVPIKNGTHFVLKKLRKEVLKRLL